MSWPIEPGDGPFVVVARRSGVRIEVGADQTILEALEDAGVFVNMQCQSGVCGTCVTPVVEGMPEHRDDYQTDEEHASNAQINVCCSRSRSDVLVLDL
jgi:vanillate monooxygenase ferredoxin subunit